MRYVYRGGKRIGQEVLTGAKTGLRRWVAQETFRRLSNNASRRKK